jgi:hypothetical protein
MAKQKPELPQGTLDMLVKAQANRLHFVCSLCEGLQDRWTAVATLAVPIRPLGRVRHARRDGRPGLASIRSSAMSSPA